MTKLPDCLQLKFLQPGDLSWRLLTAETNKEKLLNTQFKGDLELRKQGNVSTEMEPFKKRPIYKVPTFIADQNKNVYSPHAVSFGPYHHGEPPLKPTESHKKRSLLHFLENRAEVQVSPKWKKS
ncbi:unnamed protein product [Ilex paraguariensis]|uniref:Uncharacterized protein n=1 Tax=Ilex paraguariensis TaxID=185542 RepID=A0ABC8RN61_9AQUA